MRAQTASPDFTSALVYLLSKIIAFDGRCAVDILDTDDHTFFVKYLADRTAPVAPNPPNTPLVGPHAPPGTIPPPPPPATHGKSGSVPPGSSDATEADTAFAIDDDQRCAALYVVCQLMTVKPRGQRALFVAGLLPVLLRMCYDPSVAVTRWACLAIYRLCDGYDDAVVAALSYVDSQPPPAPPKLPDVSTAFTGVKGDAGESRQRLRSRSSVSASIERVPGTLPTLRRLLSHPSPDVRASACLALSGLVRWTGYEQFTTMRVFSEGARALPASGFEVHDTRHPPHIAFALSVAEFCRKHPPAIPVHRMTCARGANGPHALSTATQSLLLSAQRRGRKSRDGSIIDELSPSHQPMRPPSMPRLDTLVLPPAISTPRGDSKAVFVLNGGDGGGLGTSTPKAAGTSFVFPAPIVTAPTPTNMDGGEVLMTGPPPPDLLQLGLMLTAQLSKGEPEPSVSVSPKPKEPSGARTPGRSVVVHASMSPGPRRTATATLSATRASRPPSVGSGSRGGGGSEFTFDRPPSAPPANTRVATSAPNSPPTPVTDTFSVGKVNKLATQALTLSKSSSMGGPFIPSLTSTLKPVIQPPPSLKRQPSASPPEPPLLQTEEREPTTPTTLPPAPPKPIKTPVPPPPPPAPYIPPTRQVQEALTALYLLPCLSDASPIVRQQALLGIDRLVSTDPHATAWNLIIQLHRDRKEGGGGDVSDGDIGFADARRGQPRAGSEHAPLTNIGSALSEVGLMDAHVSARAPLVSVCHWPVCACRMRLRYPVIPSPAVRCVQNRCVSPLPPRHAVHRTNQRPLGLKAHPNYQPLRPCSVVHVTPSARLLSCT